MLHIDANEFQQRLPTYLEQVREGEEIQISSHGKVFAKISPVQVSSAAEALKRLDAVRGTMILGDILAPMDEEDWSADADHV